MTKNKLYGFVLLISLAGYIYLFFAFKEAISEKTTLCLFRKITGIPCPSCGTTHSIIYLLHGNFLNAFKANPLGFIMTIAIVAFPLWIIIDLLLKKNSFYLFYQKTENLFKKKWIAIPAIILILLLWIFNIKRNL